MILHRLEFEAFMAYPERQSIDFTELNTAGVFLLNGPTGAGKTTILDAICYALYGGTTGDRDATQLHSTYATNSGTKPYVFLDLTLQGRRIRVERTPAYTRPITRGARKGQLTEESAKATLSELIPGGDPEDKKAWNPIASQVKEVNTNIAERIHLNREQFLKVMLLAQGQFAQFLKSKPNERKELLKKMFPVEHIEAIYTELIEEAKQARQDVAQDERTTENYLNRARTEMQTLAESFIDLSFDGENPEQDTSSTHVAQESGKTPIEEIATADAANITAETLEAWLTQGIQRAVSASTREHKERERLILETDRHTQLLAERTQLRADWSEYEQLTARRKRLAEECQQQEQRREELARARAAAPLAARYTRIRTEEKNIEMQRIQQAEDALTLEATRDKLLRNLRADGETPADSAPYLEEELFIALAVEESAEARGQRLDETLTALHALQKREALLQQEECTSEQTRAKAEQLAQKTEAAAQKLAELKNRTQKIQENLAGYEKTEEEHTLALHTAEEAEKKHAEARQIQQQIDAARAAADEAKKQSARTLQAQQKAQQIWQEAARTALEATEAFKALQVQRLAQASSLLARELVEGEPCPVCGSEEHPKPARVSEGETLIEQADLDAAKDREDRAYDASQACEEAKEKADLVHQQASEALIRARSQFEALTIGERVDPEQSAQHLAQARKKVKQAAAHFAERDALRKNHEQVEADRKAAEETHHTLHDALTEAQALHRESLKRRDALIRELEPSMAAVVLADRIKSLENYRTLAQRQEKKELLLNSAVQQHTQYLQETQSLLQASPFTDRTAVLEAERTEAQIQALEESVNDYEREVARVSEGLGREAMQKIAARVAAGEEEPDDQQELKDRLDALRTRVQQMMRREGERNGLLRSVQKLRSDFAAFRDQTAERFDRATMLSALASAARGDTQCGYEHQVDLVSYVLGGEFEQILRVASGHLNRMSDGRYGMKYSERSAKHSSVGGGLNLDITDTWTGQTREASSLSGGESFLASLALALGLAEVVQANNGGIELDTLFIDEGFGTLDGETLDTVMGTIDSLRNSGRTIGLISHVEEMKNRIPAQIMVEKGQRGSSLRVNSY